MGVGRGMFFDSLFLLVRGVGLGLGTGVFYIHTHALETRLVALCLSRRATKNTTRLL